MDTKKLLYFLDFLNQNTEGASHEIAHMYNNVLDETDCVNELKSAISNNTFFGEIGKMLLDDSKKLIEEVYLNPSKALEMLPHLVQAQRRIDSALDNSSGIVESPYPLNGAMTVLDSKSITAYIAALRQIASTCVYLICVYDGLDGIRELNWNDAGVQESLYAVNTKFLAKLLKVKRPGYAWVIRKRRLGGRNLFGGDAFYLTYESISEIKLLTADVHKEKISSHAYLNITAHDLDLLDVPYCWGIGNIVSATPANAMQFLSKRVVTKLRAPSHDNLRRKVPIPTECLKVLADGLDYCISPDQLLVYMNQWQVGHEIEKRKQEHSCLFCGRHLTNKKLVCDEHFGTEFT